MSSIRVNIGEERFEARLHDELTPLTCARFRALLPWSQKLVHARWIGQGCWIPVRGVHFEVDHENASLGPRPGEFIFYPSPNTEAAILLAYGSVDFSAYGGPPAGNPFMTIADGLDRLAEIGRDIACSGAKTVTFGCR